MEFSFSFTKHKIIFWCFSKHSILVVWSFFEVLIDSYVVHFHCSCLNKLCYFSHILILLLIKLSYDFVFCLGFCTCYQGFDTRLIDMNRTCKVTKVFHKSVLPAMLSLLSFVYVLSLVWISWSREDKLWSILPW